MFYPVQSAAYVFQTAPQIVRWLFRSKFGYAITFLFGVVILLSAIYVSFAWAFVILVMGVLSIIDVFSRIVPDVLIVLLGLCMWLCLSDTQHNTYVVIAFLLFFLTLRVGVEKLKGRAVVGWGDIKLMAVMLFFLPLNTLPIYFLAAGVIGGGSVLIYRNYSQGIPFVPALSIAWLVAWLVK